MGRNSGLCCHRDKIACAEGYSVLSTTLASDHTVISQGSQHAQISESIERVPYTMA